MVELEETWTEQSFYNKPLSVWFGEEICNDSSQLLDVFTAASIGCYQRVKDLIAEDGSVCNCKNISGWTALMYAAHYGHMDITDLLLMSNASVHIRNNNGCNALMIAVMCGHNLIVEKLIKAGCILEARDNRDWTAIFHAIYTGHHNVVDTLLKYRLNLNSCERGTGMTPLMYAAQMGDANLVTTLLQKGALTSLTTYQGHTATRIAQDAGFKDIACIIAQWEFQGINDPCLYDGPAAMEARRLEQQPIQRPRGNSVPNIDQANVQPTDLETLLNQLGLRMYINIFREQDVDLQVFLTLTDQDLKECGIQKLGPRRKMTSAIARWHSNAPLRNDLECAYADKLEVEMQELGVKLAEVVQTLKQTKAQVNQENDLRAVTESWVVEARGRLQECHQRLQSLMSQVETVQRCATLLSSSQLHSVKLPHMQPAIISTVMEAVTLIGSQTDTLLTLTDPSVPRGPSNPATAQRKLDKNSASTCR
ncbi:Ankyrin repeat and SAM domain-containing protein 3 [Halocaridina rubra]|uniref:Ankyrin repeat and SAM domain-containing protein 3 n=1 Tax=Halocaridina rubra TaxID=373956 RepID=A0AAN9AEZ0_HALRR